ncbi:MAG: LCP family protein, partial [Ruminococcus sp.]|nr:LCP family protein [Candidatus Copronaster equi]
IYFGNHQNRDTNNNRNIELSRDENALQEKLKQEKYEQIIRNQQKNNRYSSDYQDYQSSQTNRNIYNQRIDNRQPLYQNDYGNMHYEDFSPNRNPSPNKPPIKKEPKKRGCGTIFTCLILIVALISGATFGYVFSMCNKTNYIDEERTDSEYMQYRDNSVYNVLLIGTDKEEGGISRSDTMMLVSLDKNNKVIKMTSFMRDMWVDIPDNGSAKLNAAYAYGGANLLVKTLEKNFDIYIDNYVMVNFDMFKQLIDGLGGVTVEITQEEASFINRTSHAKVQPGINTLNGDYALIYCRIRKLDSDFMRTQRQRKVMTAIIHQMTTQSLFKTGKAVSDILPLVTTDIPPFNMTLRIFSGISLLGYSNDQLRIPCDGMYSSRYVQGQSALVPDIDANKAELHKFLYNR